MQSLEWSEEYSVGIPSIDAQHKVLVATIKELSEAMVKGEGSKKLTSIFDNIVRYTANHFTYEEELLAKHGYPNLSLHKVEHELLVKQVFELQDKFNSGKAAISVATHKFLMSWLTNHILGTDKQYMAFLLSKGAK